MDSHLVDLVNSTVDYVQQHSVRDVIRHYGAQTFYIITFVWTFLEGETFVIFAGIAAAHHYLRIEFLILSAWLGSFAGDQLFFWIGRKFGKRIFKRFPKLEKPRRTVLGWVEKHSTGFILSYRFLYGLRNVSALAIGMSQIPWTRYAKLNLVGAFIWATSFAGVGYLFGDVLGNMIESSAIGFTIAVVLLIGFLVGVRYAVRKFREREEGPDNEGG